MTSTQPIIVPPNPPSPSPNHHPPSSATPASPLKPGDMPFLAASLLTIWTRSIHPSIPLHVSYAAKAISDHIPDSHERKWRLEFRQQTNTYPVVGERKVVDLIVWAWAAEVRPDLAAEIMVVLHTEPYTSLSKARRLESRDEKVEGMGTFKECGVGPRVESVAWRFGPGSGRSEDKGEDAWRDWRMIHTTGYYAIDPASEAGKTGSQMTGDLIRLVLNEGKTLTEKSVLELLMRGVRKGLGRPYEPKQAELLDRLGRIQMRLVGQGKTVGGVTVRRKLRKTSKGYLPNISIAVHVKEAVDQRQTSEDAVEWGKDDPAAVILIDVWGNGKVKLMGVMYEEENPVVHYYRDQYPPPSSNRVERAVIDVRATRRAWEINGEGEQTVIGDGTEWEAEKPVLLERL